MADLSDLRRSPVGSVRVETSKAVIAWTRLHTERFGCPNESEVWEMIDIVNRTACMLQETGMPVTLDALLYHIEEILLTHQLGELR
jgi:hypothetical protein